MVRRRHFSGADDLIAMQNLVAERTRAMGPCTNLHPGDVAHRIYSGSRRYDLDDVIPVFEDGSGLVGFGLVWPDDHAFDVITRTEMAMADRVAIIGEVADLATRKGSVETDVIGDDTSFTNILTDLGFYPKRPEYVITSQDLDTCTTVPLHDFTVRSVSASDAEQLASVHGGAFGSTWTPDEYAERMRKPGYKADDELVAIDADGTFMGFAVTWYDDVNNVGYFEPVGVHRDYHRRGVGSVLLSEGMRVMQEAGMTTATVLHAKDEARAVAFYRSNGFDVCSVVTPWERQLLSDPMTVRE
jgi:mycothiol synthase